MVDTLKRRDFLKATHRWQRLRIKCGLTARNWHPGPLALQIRILSIIES